MSGCKSGHRYKHKSSWRWRFHIRKFSLVKNKSCTNYCSMGFSAGIWKKKMAKSDTESVRSCRWLWKKWQTLVCLISQTKPPSISSFYCITREHLHKHLQYMTNPWPREHHSLSSLTMIHEIAMSSPGVGREHRVLIPKFKPVVQQQQNTRDSEKMLTDPIDTCLSALSSCTSWCNTRRQWLPNE